MDIKLGAQAAQQFAVFGASNSLSLDINPAEPAALETIANRIGVLLDRACNINGNLAGMRSNVFGEGESADPSAASGEFAGKAPCLLARITRAVDLLDNELSRVSQQVDAVRRLG